MWLNVAGVFSFRLMSACIFNHTTPVSHLTALNVEISFYYCPFLSEESYGKRELKSSGPPIFAACVCACTRSVDASHVCRNVKHYGEKHREKCIFFWSTVGASPCSVHTWVWNKSCQPGVAPKKHLQMARIPGQTNGREWSILLPNPCRNAQHAADRWAQDTCTPSVMSVRHSRL